MLKLNEHEEIKSGDISKMHGDLSEYLLVKSWMKWPRHVERMDDNRLPRVASVHRGERRG